MQADIIKIDIPKFKGRHCSVYECFNHGRLKNSKKDAIHNLKHFLDCIVSFSMKYKSKEHTIPQFLLNNIPQQAWEIEMLFKNDKVREDFGEAIASRTLAAHLLLIAQKSPLCQSDNNNKVKFDDITDIVCKLVQLNND